MKPFQKISGGVAPLDIPNVDTDQIIPKQFLKRIERAGFGAFLFFDWRFIEGGRLNPTFEMNAPWHRGASILLARANFGCGSSREHAPWALLDYGITCLIAPSFADIFYNNCFKNGMLPVTLPEAQIETLFQQVRSAAAQGRPHTIAVDLVAQTVTSETFRYPFQVDPFRRRCLLEGLDDVGLTLQHESEIRRFELAHSDIAPRAVA